MRDLQDIITLLRPGAGFQISVWMEKVRNTPRTLDPGSRRVCGPTGCQSSCQVLVSCFMNVAIHAFLTQVVWFVDLRSNAKGSFVLLLSDLCGFLCICCIQYRKGQYSESVT